MRITHRIEQISSKGTDEEGLAKEKENDPGLGEDEGHCCRKGWVCQLTSQCRQSGPTWLQSEQVQHTPPETCDKSWTVVTERTCEECQPRDLREIEEEEASRHHTARDEQRAEEKGKDGKEELGV